jgi:hypothetical protein
MGLCKRAISQDEVALVRLVPQVLGLAWVLLPIVSVSHPQVPGLDTALHGSLRHRISIGNGIRNLGGRAETTPRGQWASMHTGSQC